MSSRALVVTLVLAVCIVLAVSLVLTQTLAPTTKPSSLPSTGHEVEVVTVKACPTWPNVSVRYARLFRLYRLSPHYLVLIDSANNTFVLVPRGCPPPHNATGVIVYVPVRKVVYFSATEVALLYRIAKEMNNLTMLRTIAGICFRNIWLPEVAELVRNGSIAYLGSSWSPNFEKILLLEPDVVIIYTGLPVMEQVYEKLRSYNLTVLVDNEWLEKSFLARFEWIKAIAALYGPEALEIADKVFTSVEKLYKKLIELGSSLGKTSYAWLTVYQGNIWVPRVDSYVVKTLENLSGSYVFTTSALVGTGSAKVSPEFVAARILGADVVIIASMPPYTRSLSEVVDVVPAILKSPAVKSHRVFLMHPSYYQLGYAYTDLLLLDLLSLLHPDVAVRTFPEHLRKFFMHTYLDNVMEIVESRPQITVTWRGYYKVLRDAANRTILLVPWGLKVEGRFSDVIETPSDVVLSPRCSVLAKGLLEQLAGKHVYLAKTLTELEELAKKNRVLVLDMSELDLVLKLKPTHYVVLNCTDTGASKIIWMILGYDELGYMASS